MALKDVCDRLRYDLKNLYFWQKWLLPRSLKQVVYSDSVSDFDIYNSFVNDIRFFHKYFPCIRIFISHVRDCLILAKEAGLLNGAAAEANFNALAAHANPWSVTDAIGKMYRVGLLQGDSGRVNFDAILSHADPESVSSVLGSLYDIGLLQGDLRRTNFNAIMSHPRLEEVDRVLILLCTAGLLQGELSQISFTGLLRHSSILYGSLEVRELWDRVPLLTAAQFQEIIRLCTAHEANLIEARHQFISYVNRTILGIPDTPARTINHAQSTHTTSVHRSVSESVIRLKERYKVPAAEVDRLVKFLVKVIHSTTAASLMDKTTLDFEKVNFELAAAKRGITRITSDLFYLNFKDPASQVSLRELLALVAKIIEDEANWEPGVTRIDVIRALISSFYQIQRGYNINEAGVDNRQRSDGRTCVSGTFNQVLASFQSIHPDVIIRMVTQQSALLRFPVIVKECLIDYLKAHPISAAQMKTLLAEGVGELITTIAEPVKAKMVAEFHDLYETRDAPELNDIVMTSVGPWVEIKAEELAQAGIEIKAEKELTVTDGVAQESSLKRYSIFATSTTLTPLSLQNPEGEQAIPLPVVA